MNTRLLFALIIAAAPLSAQNLPATPATLANIEPPKGCTAELQGNRPKIYIANFYVTYGKKDMGKAIGDFIAEKFEADGRLEVISRSMINEEMKGLLNNKKLKPEKYLAQTLAYAAGKNADCVVFGRISKNKSKVAFLVRMAAVESGENLRKVDTDVEVSEALKFLETVGDSFVTYFKTAPPKVIAQPVEKEEPRAKPKGFYAGASAIGLMPFGFVKNGFELAAGGNAEFGHKGKLHKDIFFGVNLEYLHYIPKDETFVSLYGAGSYGLAGYEYLTYDWLHFQLVLYGGYQFGRLVGAVEAVNYGYGMFMAGTRAVIDFNNKFSLTLEPRYVLAIAGTTMIQSAAASVGALWRF